MGNKSGIAFDYFITEIHHMQQDTKSVEEKCFFLKQNENINNTKKKSNQNKQIEPSYMQATFCGFLHIPPVS